MEAIACIHPSAITGSLAAPPSKSAAHRALICAALAGGGRVEGVLPSADMRATLGAVEALGAAVHQIGEEVSITRAALPIEGEAPVVDCLESGSTLRLLLPVFAAKGSPPPSSAGAGCPSARWASMLTACPPTASRFAAPAGCP